MSALCKSKRTGTLVIVLLLLAGCGGKNVRTSIPSTPKIPQVPLEVLAVIGTPKSIITLPVLADGVTHGKSGPGFWVYRDKVIGIKPDDPRCLPGVFDLGSNIILKTDVCFVTSAVEAKYSIEGVDLVLLYLAE